MSKSLGNYIGVTEPPEEMFGKLMRVPDDGDGGPTTSCCSARRSTRSRRPVEAKRALARAHRGALPRRGGRGGGRGALRPRAQGAPAARGDRGGRALPERTDAASTCRRCCADALRHLAQRGAPAAGPGRGAARRRAARRTASSTSPADRLDGAVLQVGRSGASSVSAAPPATAILPGAGRWTRLRAPEGAQSLISATLAGRRQGS